MPEYRENTKTIQERHWRRAQKVVIETPTSRGTRWKAFRFVEEDVVEKDGAVVATPSGEVVVELVPATSFALLNPADGQPTGQTMTHGQLFAALYSLYRAAATERDTK